MPPSTAKAWFSLAEPHALEMCRPLVMSAWAGCSPSHFSECHASSPSAATCPAGKPAAYFNPRMLSTQTTSALRVCVCVLCLNSSVHWSGTDPGRPRRLVGRALCKASLRSHAFFSLERSHIQAWKTNRVFSCPFGTDSGIECSNCHHMLDMYLLFSLWGR